MSNRMLKYLPLLAALTLSGCVGNPPRPAETVRHDLGDPGQPWAFTGFPIAAVSVSAAGWLDSTAQTYRLDYADGLQRHAYARSRWVATAPELLEHFLQRQIVAGQPEVDGAGCRLALSLDELEQRFTTPSASHVVLEARVRLLSPQGSTELAKRGFLLSRASLTPDAQGGAAAVRLLAQVLAGEMAGWLDAQVRKRPELVSRCKENKP
jgi:cholesterol transport system auxiliary component